MPICLRQEKSWIGDRLKEEMRLASERYLGEMAPVVSELRELFDESREEYLIPRLYDPRAVWFGEYFEKAD